MIHFSVKVFKRCMFDYVGKLMKQHVVALSRFNYFILPDTVCVFYNHGKLNSMGL